MTPLFGEEVNDTVERLVRAVRVQCCDAKMPGLGELNAVHHRLLIANLTDHDDIWGLTKCVLQSVMPVVRIDTDFAVRNDTAVMRMHILDGVLDRDDVAVRILVTVSDHRRKSRRLTGARTTDDETQSALCHRDVFELIRQLQFLKRRNLGYDRTQHGTDAPLLHESTDAKSTDPLRCDSEVTFLCRVEFFCLAIVHD